MGGDVREGLAALQILELIALERQNALSGNDFEPARSPGPDEAAIDPDGCVALTGVTAG